MNHVKCVNTLHERNVLLIVKPAGILTTSLSVGRVQVSVVGSYWQNCHLWLFLYYHVNILS